MAFVNGLHLFFNFTKNSILDVAVVLDPLQQYAMKVNYMNYINDVFHILQLIAMLITTAFSSL